MNVNHWQKRIRATVIKNHLTSLGTIKCVCFSCGNSAQALTQAGLNVVYVGSNAKLIPGTWFSYSEIGHAFGLFDATSGHLPWPLMMEIAAAMRGEMPEYTGPLGIPTGSGETYVTLTLAYPHKRFLPVRLQTEETCFDPGAPLNSLVDLLAKRAISTRE